MVYCPNICYMVAMSEEKKAGAAGGVEKIRHAASSRARYLRFDVTLIATFYSVEPLMPAALTFQPKKIILLVNTLDDHVKDNVDKVKQMFGKLVDISTVKMPEEDLVGFAEKFVEILDNEPKSRMIVVS